MSRPEFMIEDRVWYIPDGARFAVLATITGVSRAIAKGSFYFYELDEPGGHSVPDNELCLEKYKDSAEEALKDKCEEYSDGHDSLEEWRRSMVDFIFSTHNSTERWPWMEEDYYPERSDSELIYLDEPK